MRTIIDIITALQGFPSTAPVRVELTGADGRRVVHDIQGIEMHENGIILVVERQPTAETSESPKEPPGRADQTGEVIAVPPPPAVPGGLEGEGEEPPPPGSR